MMTLFHIAAAIAVISTCLAIIQRNAVRALLYLIVSLLSVAVIFFLLGAPFAAALEVITYAGAIMVLFVFVIMLLNLGPASERQEQAWLGRKTWLGPVILAAVLLAEWLHAFIAAGNAGSRAIVSIGPERVGEALLGPYAVGVELASVLLLAGLVGAYHLGAHAVSASIRSAAQAPQQEPTPGLRWVDPSEPVEKKAGLS